MRHGSRCLRKKNFCSPGARSRYFLLVPTKSVVFDAYRYDVLLKRSRPLPKRSLDLQPKPASHVKTRSNAGN
jgi:hypothetical protein